MIRRQSSIPLYQQIRQQLKGEIENGTYPPGSVLPTEEELCERFGVSRYPLRQAMAALVNDGLLDRTRGKGTFVCEKIEDMTEPAGLRKTIALILPEIAGDYAHDIIEGFIRSATLHEFAAIVSGSIYDKDERTAVERMVNAGASGIVLFPASTPPESEQLRKILQDLTARGIYIALIDRNPGLEHIDFVSTDNTSGGFLAARHMRLQGYRSAVFLANTLQVSAVQERLQGFRRGLQQYHLTLLNPQIQGRSPEYDDSADGTDYSYDAFIRQLDEYRQYLPFAVFCENDTLAVHVLDKLSELGFDVGNEIGVIGFDNISQGKYHQPALTTISQNGVLLGQSAADMAISRLISGSKQSVRHILPTQVIIRKSCGEEHART